MKHPIDYIDTAYACKDPEVRRAGAGGACIIMLIGGLFLLGPILWVLIQAFWQPLLYLFGFCLLCAFLELFNKK